MALRTVACCLLVLFAGCSGLGGGPAPTATLTPAPAAADTATPTDTPVGATPVYSAQVEVSAYRAPPTRVVVRALATNRTVVNESFAGDFEADYDETTALEPERDYAVTVRTNGTVAWEETVRSYERYELYVDRNGSVRVTGRVVA